MAKRRSRLALLAALAVAMVVAGSQQESNTNLIQESDANLIKNGSFENGWQYSPSIWWDKDGNVHSTTFGEIFTPTGFMVFFFDGTTCQGEPPYDKNGRPEVQIFHRSRDPNRVYSGKWATQWFSFHRCSDGGIFQVVPVEPGKYYWLTVRAHSWYTNYSDDKYGPPRNWDGSYIDWAHDTLSIGVDFSGMINPNAESVTWASMEQYGVYGRKLMLLVRATSDTAIVYFRRTTTHPLRHNDAYLDDFRMEERRVTFIPMVING